MQQQFHTDRPNQVWVSDITAFKFGDKYYYLCAIIDLFSREIISYRVSQNSSTPEKGLMFHSNRGTQYMSFAFVHLLESFEIKQSFSRTGRPHDNAVAEAFFSILKKEELYRRHYTSEADLMKGIHRFIDFYNSERPHSTIQYKTPEQKEKEYWNKKKESSFV